MAEAYDTESLTVHDNRCRGCLKHITFPLHKRQTSFSLGEWHVMGGYICWLQHVNHFAVKSGHSYHLRLYNVRILSSGKPEF